MYMHTKICRHTDSCAGSAPPRIVNWHITVCVHIYIWIHTHNCVCTYIYMNTYVYIHTFTNIEAAQHLCWLRTSSNRKLIHNCVCTYIYRYVYEYICIYTYIHKHRGSTTPVLALHLLKSQFDAYTCTIWQICVYTNVYTYRYMYIYMYMYMHSQTSRQHDTCAGFTPPPVPIWDIHV